MEQKVYVIGIGPGAYEEMTIRAVKALKECDVIIGYTVYVDLVKEHFPGKRFLTTPMTWEVKRCEMALREAEAGQVTAMICSGDAGVYGMAGLMYEMREHMELGGVKITVIPGITAATAGAARLGAPLIHDFAAERYCAAVGIRVCARRRGKRPVSGRVLCPARPGANGGPARYGAGAGRGGLLVFPQPVHPRAGIAGCFNGSL